jgi:hypothetical protein
MKPDFFVDRHANLAPLKTFNNKKGKAIHVLGRGGPQSCGTSRFPHFLDNRFTDGVSGRPLLPGRFLELISVRG